MMSVGILDPEGLKNNPLTNEPYENLYKHIKKTINGEDLNATYANLAKIWSTKKVYEYRNEILETIHNNQITLLIAGTGVGKTVLLPKFALHSLNYKKKVITTIPKKLVTKATASFAAQCLDVKLGEHVGYYYRGENKTNANNVDSKLIFTTTGSLISRITGDDPLLSDYDCIIVDEAHERTVQTDQLLLLLKKAAIKRPDLKIIIMSATIDLNVFRKYFPKTKFKFGEIDVGSELTYPVKQLWLNEMVKDWHLKAAEITLNILKNSSSGDILIFGRSGADANKICTFIYTLLKTHQKKINNYEINPICIKLAGNSTKEEENLATDEFLYKETKNEKNINYNRKIVIATNVAESSVTIDGVVYVIDSGLEFSEFYYADKMVRSLVEEYAPQSSIIQRKGRAGRTKPGYCYHLYTESHFKKLSKYTIPSIQKSDITSDILNLMNLEYIKNVKDLKKLLNEFISPPSNTLIDASLQTLEALNAITTIENNGTLSLIGKAISQFRVIKPNMAKTILASYYYGCYIDVINIIACLIQADGMMDNIFLKFYPDIKKTKQQNSKDLIKYKTIRKRFTHNTGDYLTLLNIYNEFIYQKKLNKQTIKLKTANLDIELEDNVNDTIKSVIDATDLQEGGADDKKLKQWCQKNYINYKKIKYVTVLANSIKRKLFTVVNIKKKNIKKNIGSKQTFKTYEDKILYVFLHGNFIFTAKNTMGSVYKTVFPLQKSIGAVNRDSFFDLKADVIMFDELFMTSKNAKLLKYNMVNGISNYLLDLIKPVIGDIIPKLFTKEKKLQHNKVNKQQKNKQQKKKTKKKKKKKKLPNYKKKNTRKRKMLL